jgi:hypothetical protein
MARGRIANIWPFDSFSKTTYYNIRKGTKSTTKPAATKWNYKGYSIRKTFDTYSGETYYTVPKLDPDSQFDSLMDAKRFIKGWVGNPYQVGEKFFNNFKKAIVYGQKLANKTNKNVEIIAFTTGNKQIEYTAKVVSPISEKKVSNFGRIKRARVKNMVVVIRNPARWLRYYNDYK